MKFFYLLILLPVLTWAQTSYVPAAYLLKKGGSQLGFGMDYFSTTKTVDKDSTNNSLADGSSYTRIQSEFNGLYGLTDEFQIGVGARYRLNEAKFTDLNGTDKSETSSGLQSTYAGFSFGFPKVDKWKFAVEGAFRFTPYTNEEHSLAKPGKLILGDDGNEYWGGLALTYSSAGNNYLSFRGGYRRPGKDLSAEIYWQAEGALAWKYLALVAGVDGVSSMNNDPYEDDTAGRPIRNTGGSELYNSSNREWISPYAGANIAFGKLWRVEFKASQVVSGRSTDLGTSFGINLIRRSDKIETKQLDKSFKSYDIEANVTKVSPKKEFVVIDKGLTSDIAKGMRFDIFENDYLGGNVLVAIGTVIQVKTETAIVRITQRYNLKKDLKEGLIARGSLQ
jgi:hypothetical protein